MLKNIFIKLLKKLKQKFASIMPAIIGAFILFCIIAIILYIVKPLMPDHLLEAIDLISSSNWQENRDKLKMFFDGFGESKKYIFVFLQLLQVLFVPIPGQVTGLLGGFLFGFWHGLFLTILGLSIGSFIAMAGARIFGETIVRKFVPKHVMAKFDYLITEGGIFNFFMIFLLPALPDDAVCFIGGLTRLSLWKLMFVCVFGRLPGMAVLAFAGSSVSSNENLFLAKTIFAVAMILAFFVWLFDKEIKEFFYKLSRI